MDLGTTVSHFELLERIGRGGMAFVYKARDLRLGRLVALKLLAPGLETREEARLRFLVEARAISSLDHPNVCTLYEIGETDDGRMFLAMAYVDGGTLRDRLAQGPLEPLEAALLAAQVAEGLGAAHARGIIHRDIKPGNLLLGAGLVKIADFGVARLSDQTTITRDGQALGTWSYMSPEQVNGEEVTPAADLWSLGVVLFEMVTGKRPFRGRSEPELIRKILETEPPPLGIGGPRLARIVARALEKSPELRYASACEMREDLLEAADTLAGREPDTWPGFLPIGSAVAPAYRSAIETPVLHNLPFPPIGDLFKGRHEELQALAQSLAEDGPSGLQAYVIHGLGGIGKTRLAVEYAWRFGRRYRAVLFVLADSPDGLDSGLAALAGADLLDLKERTTPSQNETLAAVLRWLRENPGWLLILDNVDTREARQAVAKLLPALTGGRVLITSRRRDWPAGIRRQAIDRVLLQPAAEFLLERTGEDRKRQPDDAEQALRLAELLDGLPLALEQAAAYIVHTRRSFAEYLEDWQRESEAVLGWHDDGVMQYPASLAITWQRSFHQLPPTARAILRLASFLAPDPIPSEIFESAPETVGKAALLSPEDGEPEPGRPVREDLAELRSLSLISAAEPRSLFTVHRLMQEVVRNRTPEDLRAAWLDLSMELMSRYSHIPADDSSNWPLWDVLRPHMVQTLTAWVRQGIESDAAARLMTSLGALFLAKGLYAEAEPWLLKVLETDEAAFGAEHPEVAGDLNNLSLLYKAMQRYEEAERLMRRALKISRMYGHAPLDVTKELNGLALILMEQHRWTEAEELLREALALDEGVHEISLVRDLHNLALLLASMGRPCEGEPLIRQALELSRQVHGPAHPKTARKMQILAGILRDLGRADEVEPLFREALEIFEGILGPDHPLSRSARRDLESVTAA